MAGADSLRVELSDGVLRLTLNRPEKRNALDSGTCRALVEALETADARVALLEGAGASFCSGMDLDESLTVDWSELAALHERLFTVGRWSRFPIVASVRGHAIAGGMGLVANAHVVVADEDAKFGLPEVKVGMWPFLIFRAVEAAAGARRTTEWSLTGRVVECGEAMEAGLVHMYDAGRAAHVAAEIASRPEEAIRLGMRYVRESRGLGHGEQGELARRLRLELLASPGYAEAVRSRGRK